MRTRSIALVCLALVAACGSDAGAAAQPEDEFLDLVEAECRTASKGIDALDLDLLAVGQLDAAVDVLSSALDALRELEPLNSQKKDFDNMVGGIADLVSEGKDLSTAITAADLDAQAASIANIDEASTETDRSAQALGALRCKFLLPPGAFGASLPNDSIPIDTVPIDTVPIDTIPIDTTPIDTTPIDTTPIDTTPIETVPIETVPIETVPIETVPVSVAAGGSQALDITEAYVAPAGFEWVTIDLIGIEGPSSSVLTPILSAYFYGRAENTATGEYALISVTVTNLADGDTWTTEQTAVLAEFELLTDTWTEVTSPGGHLVLVATGVGEDSTTDAGLSLVERSSIGVLASSGTDVQSIIDGFFAVNTIG